MGKRKIDFDLFVKWLQYSIETAKRIEEKEAKSGNYINALVVKEERDTYEFILRNITSDKKYEIPDFVEVEE